MALEVKLGSTTLTSGGSTALGNIRSTAHPQLSLIFTNPDATTLTDFVPTPGGDGIYGGSSLQDLSQNEIRNFILEIDTSGGAGAVSATISVAYSAGTWTHTFTGTVVATSPYTATPTIVKNDIMMDGAGIETIYKWEAHKFIDAQTTISFTSGGDDMELLIEDSANGLGDISVGDQIEVSGASNAANNFYWQVFQAGSASAIKVRIRHNLDQADMAQNRDGVTEAAGAAVTISLIPEDIACDYGSYTLGGDVSTTAEVVNVQVYNENHYTYAHVKAKPATPIAWGESVTMTASASAAWQLVNTQGNQALSAVEVRNFSQIKDASLPPGYDNWKPIDGVTEAPVGVGAELDPRTHADIIDWWDPDLETGYSDGDPIDTLTGQLGTANLVTRSGSSYPRRYDTSVHDGKAMTYLNATASTNDAFRRAWTSTGLGDWTAADRTVIFVHKIEFSPSNIKAFDKEGFRPIIYNFSNNTGVVVSAMRCDTSGNATTRLNYVSVDHTVTSEQIRFASGGGSGWAADDQAWCGFAAAFSSILTDDELDRMTRKLLAEYSAPWAPTFNVDSSTGDDANTGLSGAPLATIQEAFDRCGAFTSPHIVLAEGTEYSESLVVGQSVISDFVAGAYQFGHSHYNPICVYAKRSTMQEPYARLLGDGKITSIGTFMGFFNNLFVYGLHPRNESHIPTTSLLREAGDTAYDSGSTCSTMDRYSTSGDYATIFPYPAMASESNIWYANCIGVGCGFTTIQTEQDLGLAVHRGFVDCANAHGWGAGHTVEAYISGPATVYMRNLYPPEPGHDSTTGVEAANIFSRFLYAQYDLSCGVWLRDGIIALDGSGQQFRNGGYMERVHIVDNTTGAFGAILGMHFKDCTIEGGTRQSDGVAGHQNINRGLFSLTCTDFIADGILFLPANSTTTVQNIDLYHDPSYVSNDPTLGNTPGDQAVSLGKNQRRAVLKNITVAGREGPLLRHLQASNISLLNCIFQADADMLEFRGTEAETTDQNITIDGIVWDGSGNFATIDSAAKTETEINAISGISVSNINAQSVTFADDTRTAKAYAITKIGSGSHAEDLVYEMVRQRTTGEYNADMQVGYIIDWVRAGYLPTNVSANSGGAFDGLYPGAIQTSNMPPEYASSTPANGATGVAHNQSTVVIRWSAVGTQGLASSKFYLHDAADDSLLATIPANLALVNALDKTEQTVTLGITIGYGKSVYLLWDAGVFLSQSGVPNAANTDKTALAFSTESAPAVGGNRSRDRSRER